MSYFYIANKLPTSMIVAINMETSVDEIDAAVQVLIWHISLIIMTNV